MNMIVRSKGAFFLRCCADILRTSIAIVLMVVTQLAVADDVPLTPHNILLIIADDVGVDMIGAYKSLVGSESVPETPRIDRLAAQGILFRNAWVNPVCAATRASLQTGRYGIRTGVVETSGKLQNKEFTLGRVLHLDTNNHHATALFGKWGLAGADGTVPDPVTMGYDKYKGVLGPQILPTTDPLTTAGTYYDYAENNSVFNENSDCDQHYPASYTQAGCVNVSTPVKVTTYATTTNATDTIQWLNGIRTQSGGTRPWFVTLAFNAAHTPLNAPPPELVHTTGCATRISGVNDQSCYRAMIEAMDTEIGRVLDSIPPAEMGRTTVIFMGDNGSAPKMAVSPFDLTGNRAKGSVYEDGVNVPFIIAGADVVSKNRISKALVNGTDVFMTVLDLAGFPRSKLPTVYFDGSPSWQHDSISLLSILQEQCTTDCQIQTLREFAFAQVFTGQFKAAVRDFAGYKLIQDSGANGWRFYNLAVDPHENDNLVDSTYGTLLPSLTGSSAEQALAKLKYLLQGFPAFLTGNTIKAVNDPGADQYAHTGDINGDGKVDIADVELLQQHLIKTRTLTATEIARADIYPTWIGDGQLTVSDLLVLRKVAVKALPGR